MNLLPFPITPCCWYDGTAAEAAAAYAAAIPGSRVRSANPIMTSIELGGQPLLALNGGPIYKPNPSISMFVNLDSAEAAEAAFRALSTGMVMMPFDNYPWAERYGWCADRWGVTWQVACGLAAPVRETVCPSLLFTKAAAGKAEEAIAHYVRTIPGSSVILLDRHEPGGGETPGTIRHAQFSLGGRTFMATDSAAAHPFTFSEGVSLVVHCQTQDEVDHYWASLSEGGSEGRCGWLKDRWGVSWQVVPTVLAELMGDAERAPRVIPVFLGMTKFDIAALLRA